LGYWTRAVGYLYPTNATDAIKAVQVEAASLLILAEGYTDTGAAGLYSLDNDAIIADFFSGDGLFRYASATIQVNTNLAYPLATIAADIVNTPLAGSGDRLLMANSSGQIFASSGSIPTQYWQTSSNILSPVNSSYSLSVNENTYHGGEMILTKVLGSSISLRGYHTGPTYCSGGDNIGWVEMSAYNGVYGYSDVAAMIAVAAEPHDDKSKGTQLDFWVTPTGAGQTNLLAMTLTPAGKVKGLNGFAVFGADGMSGTAVVVTGVSYNSATKTLTFNRSVVTFNGGIATSVSATTNTVITL